MLSLIAIISIIVVILVIGVVVFQSIAKNKRANEYYYEFKYDDNLLCPVASGEHKWLNDEEIEEDIDYESFTLEGFHEEELELDDFVNDEH